MKITVSLTSGEVLRDENVQNFGVGHAGDLTIWGLTKSGCDLYVKLWLAPGSWKSVKQDQE